MKEINYGDVRPEVKKFAVGMENKLRENDYKEHWTNCSYEYLFEQFVRQYEFLDKNFPDLFDKSLDAPLHQHPYMKSNALMLADVRNIFVNVANYSMMFVDKIDKQFRSLKDCVGSEEEFLQMISESD